MEVQPADDPTDEGRVAEDATAAGRPDFLILKNGVITTFPRELNGRRYEDLNAFFQDPNLPAAIDQYLAIEAPGNLASPVLAIISERDRTGLPKEDYYAAHHS